MYTAVLIKGKTYSVMGHVFHLNQEKEIEKKVYQYLDGNEFFDCKQLDVPADDPKTDDQPKEKPSEEEEEPSLEAKIYTETELKDMKKDGQEAVIVDLGGDPSEFKNESERIAFILKQQEKAGE
ncbi:YqbF domain-containing protein [Bacillus safensis]|uniref:YqbF domain-containing protein n=1 Tax=Bacillus safensis TaxID=561879 RepID=UPI0022818067|nr:YqbF domain-containing protein [Bacillus safensis]MCY7543903.1 YqbF domain-containing protein [Bacillus safensis]MCY7550391.1 YqbF domain-containing protein [Bacillus safensis]MCY7644039.1 YqbF domain-containing protein [Bacillus safensis]MCY7654523.1 YqbF domain-containing protein [Bacillus safensis]MEC3709162.1 YqbF domain-containing protein [Bacillus safensis]